VEVLLQPVPEALVAEVLVDQLTGQTVPEALVAVAVAAMGLAGTAAQES